MPLVVENRRTQRKTLQNRHGDPLIIDVTSQGQEPWVRFSPFYPHGTIPVPFSPGTFAASVEGIWQGLKVFEKAGVDLTALQNTTMKGIKRSVRRFGKVSGHRAGVQGNQILSYLEARRSIYLPCYCWVLENCLQDQLTELRELSDKQTVVLLDYQTNGDIEDLSKPLSHAVLIKRFLEDDWPD